MKFYISVKFFVAIENCIEKLVITCKLKASSCESISPLNATQRPVATTLRIIIASVRRQTSQRTVQKYVKVRLAESSASLLNCF